MILHGIALSPFVRKVLVVAAEKGIALEAKPGMPGNTDAAFRAMSPFGKVPAFEDGDYKLSDSSAIIHYLEAKYPAHPLIPAEAKARGRTIWYDEYADTILFVPMAAIFFNRVVGPMMSMPHDPALADKAIVEALPLQLDYIENILTENEFLVGDQLTLADIAVAGPFVNIAHAGVEIDAAKYPKTVRYVANILARPSFAPLIAAETKMMGR
jgi:glutathione S-transferase